MSCVLWFGWHIDEVKKCLHSALFYSKHLIINRFRRVDTSALRLHDVCTISGSRLIRFVLRSFMLWGQDFSVGGTENSCPHNCCYAVANLMRADGSADKQQGCLHAFMYWLSTVYIVKVQSVASLCVWANMLMWQCANMLRRSAACWPEIIICVQVVHFFCLQAWPCTIFA